MRIDVVMLIGGLPEADLKRRLEILRSYASVGTEVRLVMTKNPPPSVDSLAEMELAAPGILERVIQCEREGADAVLIWGGHDPSLLSSRSLVDIPVIGPGSASMHIAAFLADYFSLIVQLPEVEQLAWRQIRDYRLEEKCIGVYSVDIPVLELGKPESYDAVKETVIESIEDGADAVCFGCMALNNHVDKLTEELRESNPGATIVHPGRTSIRLAEMLVELGLTQSRFTYPSPPKPVKL
ncbi:MAG: aspartate/glutamate racemase family protein [Candidatus Bathyarchaeota archaeon]|jgi:allantoin racemase|nr:aspartate/glutamate racemase family protein [Candidatus Bathyarchaeota archaeon]